MLRNLRHSDSINQSGFTIVEVLIVTLLTSMLTTLILFFTFNYWRFGYTVGADLDTFVTRINAEDYLREVIGTSSGFILQNSIPDVNSLSPQSFGSSYWLTQHAVPGNFVVGSSGTITPLLYYKRYSLTNTGAYIYNGLQPYEDEYILYLDGTTKQLLVRSLANTSASGNKIQTSCQAAIATATCPADKVIASDIASVDRRFFSRSGNTVDWTSVYDSSISSYIGPDYTAVEVMELTLNISKRAVLQKTNTTQNSTIIRIALRNT